VTTTTAAPDGEQHIQRYLSASCFGDPPQPRRDRHPTRQLLTFAILVALGGAKAQARGHVVANLSVGNDRALLLAVFTQLIPFIRYPAR
jgi:4-carboxymuconolactone decarboxylase